MGLVLGRWLITPSEVAWRVAPPPLFCGVCYLLKGGCRHGETHTQQQQQQQQEQRHCCGNQKPKVKWVAQQPYPEGTLHNAPTPFCQIDTTCRPRCGRREFWAQAVEIPMFPSPTGDMSTSFGCFFINRRHALWIPLKWSVILLKSQTSTGNFPEVNVSQTATGSSVTSTRFLPVHCDGSRQIFRGLEFVVGFLGAQLLFGFCD